MCSFNQESHVLVSKTSCLANILIYQHTNIAGRLQECSPNHFEDKLPGSK